MKTCTGCSTEKDSGEFNKRKDSKSGLSSRCKTCLKGDRKKYGHYKDISNARRRRNKSLNRDKYQDFLLTQSCKDCSEDNPVVLEFDHTNPSIKSYNVSQMVHDNMTWNSIKKEIDKCEVVCANCHKIRTAHQFGWTILSKI
jgi:hypothetical protein